MLNSGSWKQKVHQDNLIRPYPGHRLYAVCYEAHDVVRKWLAFLQQAPLSHVCCIIATSSQPIHPSWGFYNYSINSLQQTLQSCTLGRIMNWCHIQEHERGWSSMNQECRIDQSGATKSPVWGYGARQHQWKDCHIHRPSYWWFKIQLQWTGWRVASCNNDKNQCLLHNQEQLAHHPWLKLRRNTTLLEDQNTNCW